MLKLEDKYSEEHQETKRKIKELTLNLKDVVEDLDYYTNEDIGYALDIIKNIIDELLKIAGE